MCVFVRTSVCVKMHGIQDGESRRCLNPYCRSFCCVPSEITSLFTMNDTSLFTSDRSFILQLELICVILHATSKSLFKNYFFIYLSVTPIFQLIPVLWDVTIFMQLVLNVVPLLKLSREKSRVEKLDLRLLPYPTVDS